MDKTLITGVAHLGIRVHDLARSRVFYERLGFEFVMGPIGPEPVAILKHPAGVEINLVLNAARATDANVLMDIEEKHAGYTHVALAIRDLDAARALLDAEGIAISGGPVDYPGGARGLFIRDPDRNVVELYQPG
ncbi:MAG: VOC family protein [Myxococcales bacterium]|nr:VOC family protein [Myxococcales bacterium]